MHNHTEEQSGTMHKIGRVFFLRLNTDFKLQLSLKDVSNRIYTVILKGDDFYRQKNCWCLKNE